jgi:antirestriction protein ArdC
MSDQQVQSLSHWRGSEKTAEIVREEIAKRWGEKEAKQYDPLKNCFTFQTWKALGYQVKKGEKAIRSITYVEVKDKGDREDKTDEEEVRKYPKTVYLFYKTQVEKN